MLAREDAVSAVSLPAKERRQQQADQHDASDGSSQSDDAVIAARELLGQKRAHLGRIDVVRDEGLRRCRAPG